MYNYSQYREAYRTTAIVKQFWSESPTDIEQEARFEFGLINQKELEKYFLKIINECEARISETAESYYSRQIDFLKRKYHTTEIRKHHILIFKGRISDRVFSDHSIYNKAKKKTINNAENQNVNYYIAKHSVEIINERDLAIDKLILITDFKSEVEDSMLYANLYKRYVEEVIESWPDLFKQQDDFKKVIELLVDNKRIKQIDGKCKWLDINSDSNISFTTKQLLVVLGVDLESKNYYKISPGYKMHTNLLCSFFEEEMSPKHFGETKKSLDINSKEFKQSFNYIKIFIYKKDR